MSDKRGMPTGLQRVLAFLHPVLALASAGLLLYVASLGLRSRERGQAGLRPRHARLAPLAYAAMLLNVAVGLVSVTLLRPDLELAGSVHFRLAVGIVACLTLAALLSRGIGASQLARTVHPLLGLAALLLAGLQIFFGMALLPL